MVELEIGREAEGAEMREAGERAEGWRETRGELRGRKCRREYAEPREKIENSSCLGRTWTSCGPWVVGELREFQFGVELGVPEPAEGESLVVGVFREFKLSVSFFVRRESRSRVRRGVGVRQARLQQQPGSHRPSLLEKKKKKRKREGMNEEEEEPEEG
ncbi:hypothetical protein CRG98_024653 [Punica granatum]|uniref:Uncharacterized protein n=1 Tax=Punica granatum TaxID=22663 RepID=A0A2I0JFE2_PUNGR|nr:hypothetical protein CRG98_024653 [Punica granatum]